MTVSASSFLVMGAARRGSLFPRRPVWLRGWSGCPGPSMRGTRRHRTRHCAYRPRSTALFIHMICMFPFLPQAAPATSFFSQETAKTRPGTLPSVHFRLVHPACPRMRPHFIALTLRGSDACALPSFVQLPDTPLLRVPWLLPAHRRAVPMRLICTGSFLLNRFRTSTVI